MTQSWEPGTQYDLGNFNVLLYIGHRYKIIQPHRSQGDWTPPVTPALWGKIPDIRPQEERQQYQHEEKPWHEQHSQQVEIHQEEKEKHWYDIDDHRKKQLEIGGGLAAGVALLAGGYIAYQHHEKKSEEEKKTLVWSLQRWLHDAQERTEDFHQNGPRGPVGWILVHGRNIPQGAIVGGEENGLPIYIARAFHEGSVQVGKAGSQFEKGAVIGYGHKEIQLDTYEILIGNLHAIKWVDTEGHLKPADLGVQLVEGGREANGVLLFVAQAHHGNGVCPGKASEHLDGAFIPYGGTEERKKKYKVLALV
ncbi:carbohydrate-binding module family 12 protein [Hysterangium stoloniferum]|nr:carbohydrate-binding module family 12 protein [Hysterangium stoloniferum]